MAANDGLLGSLEARRTSLFYLAGGLMVLVAGLFAAEVFMDRELETVLGTVAPGGFGIAFLGALGLYATIRERSPWLARTGAVAFGVGVAGALVLVVGNGAAVVGLYAEAPAAIDPANLLLIVGLLLGFGAYGVGALRTGTPSRTVGVLMLWPAVVFAGIIIVVLTLLMAVSLPHWVHVVHSLSEAAVYLALGYLVRPDTRASEPAAPRTDSPA